MIYTWRCDHCKEIIEVHRPVAAHTKPPVDDEAEHEGCINTLLFTKIITPPARIIIHENEDQYWNDDNYT